MKRVFHLILLLLAGTFGGFAQSSTDLEEGNRLSVDPSTGINTFSWWGRAGRTYFIQQSDDLLNWSYAPLIESGTDQVISWSFSSTAQKYFLKLRYTDMPTSDPLSADFDGDGVSNWDEVQQGGDPFNYYSQPGVLITPQLDVISGDHQAAAAGTFVQQPLVVLVRDSATGLPMVNAPVTFTLANGEARLATAPSGIVTAISSLTVRTDLNGQVSNNQNSVYYCVPGQVGIDGQVQATTGTAVPLSFTFTNFDPYFPPVAPGALIVSSNPDGSNTLTWTDNSNNETGFLIERSSDGTSWTTAGTAGINVTTFTDGTTVPGKAYQYRVSSINVAATGFGSGNSSSSVIQDPDGDADSDGLTNAEELAMGTDPNNQNSDNDGVPDGQDAVPYDATLTYSATIDPGKVTFAVLDLGEGQLQEVSPNWQYAFVQLSDHAEIRSVTQPGQIAVTPKDAVWLANDGSVIRPQVTSTPASSYSSYVNNYYYSQSSKGHYADNPAGGPALFKIDSSYSSTLKITTYRANGSQSTNEYAAPLLADIKDQWLIYPGNYTLDSGPNNLPRQYVYTGWPVTESAGKALLGRLADGSLRLAEPDYGLFWMLQDNSYLPDGQQYTGPDHLVNIKVAADGDDEWWWWWTDLSRGPSEIAASSRSSMSAVIYTSADGTQLIKRTLFQISYVEGNNVAVGPAKYFIKSPNGAETMLVNDDGDHYRSTLSQISFSNARGGSGNPQITLSRLNSRSPKPDAVGVSKVGGVDALSLFLSEDNYTPHPLYASAQDYTASNPIRGGGGFNNLRWILLNNYQIWANGRICYTDPNYGANALHLGSDPDKWKYFNAVQLLDNGMIAGTVWKTKDAQGNPNWTQHAVLLVPVDIAVDANRDGVIKFAGNSSDPDLADKPADITTQNKPFRFWVNNNQDTPSIGSFGSEPYTYAVIKPDSENNNITAPNDLEDFARLNIYVGGLEDALKGGTIQIGLQWKNGSDKSPSIKIYENLSKDTSGNYDGTDGYLKDPDIAQLYLDSSVKSLGTVQGKKPLIFPKSYWTNILRLLSPSKQVFLIFEGVTVGRDQLTLVFLDANGNQIGQGGGVWLELLDVKNMYQRAHVIPRRTAFPQPWTIPIDGPLQSLYSRNNDNSLYVNPYSVTWAFGDGSAPDTDNTNCYDASYVPPADETKEAVVLVHGVGIDVNQYRTWGDSFYKRLWWEGYKGRFYSFRWDGETDQSDIRTVFNDAEYRAWIWGLSLANYVSGAVKPGRSNVSMVAHSLGNVVANSALKYGLKVDNYVMLAPALPASAIDHTTPVTPQLVDAETQSFIVQEARDGQQHPVIYGKKTPDTYKGYLESNRAQISGTWANYYNPGDYWLTTGKIPFAAIPVIGKNLPSYLANASSSFPLDWVSNEILFKPVDAHPLNNDLIAAFLVGTRTWRYWCKGYNPVFEMGYTFSNPYTLTSLLPLRIEVTPSGTPSGMIRAITSPEEIMSYVARPFTLPMGATPAGSSNVITNQNEHDMALDYNFTIDQREHGGLFNRPIQYLFAPSSVPNVPNWPYTLPMTNGGAYQSSIYHQLMKDLNLQSSITKKSGLP